MRFAAYGRVQYERHVVGSAASRPCRARPGINYIPKGICHCLAAFSGGRRVDRCSLSAKAWRRAGSLRNMNERDRRVQLMPHDIGEGDGEPPNKLSRKPTIAWRRRRPRRPPPSRPNAAWADRTLRPQNHRLLPLWVGTTHRRHVERDSLGAASVLSCGLGPRQSPPIVVTVGRR